MAAAPLSRYRPPPRPQDRRDGIYRRFLPPSLLQFVVLSMCLHILAILLFGAPSGGSREGRAMWGALQVQLEDSYREVLPALRIERALGESRTAPRETHARRTPPPAVARPAPPVELNPSREIVLPAVPRETPAPIPVPAPVAPPTLPAASTAPAESTAASAPAISAPPEPVPAEPLVIPPMLERVAPPRELRKLETFTVPPPTQQQVFTPPTERAQRIAPRPAPAPPPVAVEPPPAAALPPIVAPTPLEAAPAPPPPIVAPIERTVTPPAPALPTPVMPSITPPVERTQIEAPAVPVVPTAPPVERARIEAPAVPIVPTAPAVERARIETPSLPALPAAPSVERSIAPPVPAAAAPAAPAQIERAPAPAREAPSRIERELPSRLPDAGAPASPFKSPGSNDAGRAAPSPDYDPTRPNVDIDAVRTRASQLAREGTGNRALLAFPLPPVPRTKTKLEQGIEKAWKPDCKTAYQSLGLAAVVPLVANEFGEGNCRW